MWLSLWVCFQYGCAFHNRRMSLPDHSSTTLTRAFNAKNEPITQPALVLLIISQSQLIHSILGMGYQNSPMKVPIRSFPPIHPSTHLSMTHTLPYPRNHTPQTHSAHRHQNRAMTTPALSLFRISICIFAAAAHTHMDRNRETRPCWEWSFLDWGRMGYTAGVERTGGAENIRWAGIWGGGRGG